jgi:glycosyltransferase involved in cell wall biosynthesis
LNHESYFLSTKIIININILWGILKFRYDLINGLINQGYEVVIIGALDNFSDNTMDMINELKIKYYVVDMDRAQISPIKDILYLLKLVSIYRSEKPSIILNYTVKPNIYGTIAAALTNSISIATVNGLGSAIIKESYLSKVLQLMYKFAFKFSNVVLFQNQDDLTYFVSKNITTRDKAALVPGSGVDTNKYILPPINPSESLRINFIGRILKDKGVYEYIEAIKKIRQSNNIASNFYLSGIIDEHNPSGISYLQVKEWEKQGIIKYLGRTDDIREFFKVSDVVVLPSYREGLSKVLLEAASCRRPIIASDVAGCRELVLDEVTGYICAVRNPDSLRRSMLRMIEMTRDDIKMMGIKGRQHIHDNYRSEIVNDIYLDLIDRLT